MKNNDNSSAANREQHEKGFSLIELLIVLVIIGIGAAISLFYLTSSAKLYETDDQALKMVDIMQTARQYSLTKKRTVRVEINWTDKEIKLIDEKDVGTANDDEEIRKLTLLQADKVRVDMKPTNILLPPPSLAPAPDAYYEASLHPLSVGDGETFTLRFRSNGEVHNQGTNAAGNNSVPVGATIYIFPPKTGSPNEASSIGLVRGITVQGASGLIRYWGHNPEEGGGVNGSGWEDMRR